MPVTTYLERRTTGRREDWTLVVDGNVESFGLAHESAARARAADFGLTDLPVFSGWSKS